ncbi:hypothetical protein KPH14_012775 [Odynerus spinipes]|uniref:Retroviral polymerase SH3-like domain-containing protein n=1 Tax=Odynerus spinipes TaxID=1348599 RepID=A0AAD9REC8_9HYME|nr:hypothetical protein KPH14_012775 [Odynerus spinipes]
MDRTSSGRESFSGIWLTGIRYRSNTNERKTRAPFEKGYIVEYSEESKTYRIWLLCEKRINFARDVKFIGIPKITTKSEGSIEDIDYNGGDPMEVELTFPPVNQLDEEDVQHRAEIERDQHEEQVEDD